MSNGKLVNINAFKEVLNDKTVRAQIKNSLKENSGAFMSSMIDLYTGDDYLQKCDPQDVVMECLKAASLNLPLTKSLGFAYVVPYKNKPTFTIGYKGLLQLAQRSGQYKTVNADVVYESEIKSVNKLSGSIDLSGERSSDIAIGYFAYFQLQNGFEKILYMPKSEVEDWAEKYSPSANSGFSPWKTEFDKMALKTCIRRLIGTYGPMSQEMQIALAQDSEQEIIQQEISQKANAEILDGDYREIEEPAIIPENLKGALQPASNLPSPQAGDFPPDPGY